MRELFITELVKEVLGPRNGPYEMFEARQEQDMEAASPISEYITGALGPILRQAGRDIDAESGLPPGESQEYEDETDDVDIQTPPVFSPALDPDRRPTSMGISFVVSSRDSPQIEICVTWARYFSAGGVKWERRPRCRIDSINLSQSRVFWLNSNGELTNDRLSAEISVHVSVKPEQNELYYITVFLVNRIPFTAEEQSDKPRTEHHIFQPQIRVLSTKGTKVEPVDQPRRSTDEDSMLAFLYREHPLMARGHLCSAMWKEVDPERLFDNEKPEFPRCSKEPPFYWSDGVILREDDRKRFSKPDIRTEYVPLFSIPSPDLEWDSKYGAAPELRAAAYSELWSEDELRNSLMPFVTGYESWLRTASDDKLSPAEEGISNRLANGCQQILHRIMRGISLLCENEEARLAFCFANKCIDLQSRWRNDRGLVWHPFQLGFILMVLESIVNPESEHRTICDLLWVPTGTGKTEAYLAVAAFTMAYRRRRKIDSCGAGVSVITRYTLRLLTIQQYRRALAMVTAGEFLRVEGLRQGRAGWRPKSYNREGNYLWGSTPFSIGLWVGAGVTPNNLLDSGPPDRRVNGALTILRGGPGFGEPAQILNCPACNSILAVPEMGLTSGEHVIHLIIYANNEDRVTDSILQFRESSPELQISPTAIEHINGRIFVMSVRVLCFENVKSVQIDRLWQKMAHRIGGISLMSVRASRPGYFLRWYIGQSRGEKQFYDFDTFCPNSKCPLHVSWSGGSPGGLIHDSYPYLQTDMLDDRNGYIAVQEPFRTGSAFIADRIPIPALTVDDQIWAASSM